MRPLWHTGECFNYTFVRTYSTHNMTWNRGSVKEDVVITGLWMRPQQALSTRKMWIRWSWSILSLCKLINDWKVFMHVLNKTMLMDLKKYINRNLGKNYQNLRFESFLEKIYKQLIVLYAVGCISFLLNNSAIFASTVCVIRYLDRFKSKIDLMNTLTNFRICKILLETSHVILSGFWLFSQS